MRLKRIEVVKQCPHCGGEMGYYQRYFMSGWVQDNTLFDGEKYNHHMWEGMREKAKKPSKTCYCMECDKPIGTS